MPNNPTPSRFARPLPDAPAVLPAAAPARAHELGPIPAVRNDGVLKLADVIGEAGATEVTQSGAMRFHSVGDTGGRGSRDAQEQVAQHMASDFAPDGGGLNPA